MTNEIINKAIYYLKEQPSGEVKSLAPKFYHDNVNEKFDFLEILNELERIGIIDKVEGRYSLRLQIKKEIDNLPDGFNGKPYEYFKLKHDEKVKKEEKLEWYKSEIARKQYEDYPLLKKRARNAFIISIISVLIAALGLWIKWKYR